MHQNLTILVHETLAQATPTDAEEELIFMAKDGLSVKKCDFLFLRPVRYLQ